MHNVEISDIFAHEILDLRGNPTVEVEVRLPTAPSAGPPSRPAPPPARTKRSSCATATNRATAAKACCKAVENVNTEIARAAHRHRRHRPGRHRRTA